MYPITRVKSIGFLICIGGMLLISFVGWAAFRRDHRVEPHSADIPRQIVPIGQKETDEESRLAAWSRIEPRLIQHYDDVAQDYFDALDSISMFFQQRRQGARAFSAELLSYWGKYQLVRGYFNTEAHDRFLHDCFSRHIFKPEELTATVKSAVSQLVSKVKARENKLLVDIRADLSDESLGAISGLPTFRTAEDFRSQYQALLAEIAPDLSRDLGVEISKQVLDWSVVSPLVLQAGANVATRLGLSGAVVSGGVLSGPTSFGISVVVGIMLDRFLDWIFRQVGHDPEAEITSKLQSCVDQIESILLEGVWVPVNSPFDPALTWEMWGKPQPKNETRDSDADFEAFWFNRSTQSSGSGQQTVAARESGQASVATPPRGLRDDLSDLLEARYSVLESVLWTLIVSGGAK